MQRSVVNQPNPIEMFEQFLLTDSVRQVAKELGFGVSTVYRHLEELKEFHHATNYYHLMYILHFRKIINVDEIFKFKGNGILINESNSA